MTSSGNQAERAERLRRAIQAKKAGAQSRQSDLVPRPALETPRLGELQRGMWFVHHLEPLSAAYNLASAFRVRGRLDLDRLQRALDAVVSRQRLLRSSFRADGEGVVQIVRDDARILIERMAAANGEAIAVATREAARPFELGSGPLMRARLVEEAPAGDMILLVALHHLLADERSLTVLWQELAQAYDGGLSDAPPQVQYDDYVHWLTHGDGKRYQEDLAFWRRNLDPLPEELRLPFERAAPSGPVRGQWLERNVTPSTVSEVRRLAAACGATPFMLFAFAFRLLLHRYTDGRHVAFGTPVSTRSHPATADMLGYFLNPLVIAAAVDEHESVGDAVAAFSHELRQALAHSAVPFDVLAAHLAPRREVGRQPLFQVMFVYRAAEAVPRLSGVRLEPVTLDLGAAKFDLTLFVTEGESSLRTAIEFRADRFTEGSMQRMLDHYETLLADLPRDARRRIADVSCLGAREASQLATWERGPALDDARPVLLPELVLERARVDPRAPAVTCAGASQNYSELEARARAIASALAADGIRIGDRVGLFFDRSLEMMAGLLGTLLAGAAYVPLDPAYPGQRNTDVLADAGVAAVLTTSVLRGRLPVGPWLALDVDRLGQRPALDALPEILPDATAYLLYTSGSTGRPKGVVITHDNLRLSTLARLRVYDRKPARFLLVPSIAFDSSVAGIFWTLATGGALIVPSNDEVKDSHSLARLIVDERVTTLLCVPSLYDQLLHSVPDALRGLETVIVAGESCPQRLVASHFGRLPHVRLFNEYGPTEATVWATVHELSASDASAAVPIGRPIPGVRVEVLDALGRRVPAGIPGTAWIAGPTVARGYWRRDDLTAERFLAEIAEPGTARRRYRTGDRMAWTDDGVLLFLGRDDEQIKLRGYRIEPGEIEAALLEQPMIDEAAVVARPSGDGSALVAFVVAKGSDGVAGWREALSGRLPAQWVPARVVEVSSLPRLPNGKVDRRRLADMPLAPDVPVRHGDKVLSARERTLLALWEGLLGRFGIAATDNFFELGGHSLLVIQMIDVIERDFEVRLSAADVFQYPTVRELARRIEEQGGSQVRPYDQLFAIQPSGKGAPFIMVAPDFFTEGLAARFRGERPVYGVRGVSLRAEGNRGRWPTMTHLAEDVALEICRRFPGASYIVAGYSFGGWLAVETARVLERRGLPVIGLYVIAPMPVDFYRLGPLRVRIDGLQAPLKDLSASQVLRLWLRSNNLLTRPPYRRARQWLAERPWRRLLSVAAGLRQRAGLPLSPRLVQADARVERFRLHARYQPGPVRTPTVFFNPTGTASNAAATWRPYFVGPLTIRDLPDPHDERSVAAARDVVLHYLGERRFE